MITCFVNREEGSSCLSILSSSGHLLENTIGLTIGKAFWFYCAWSQASRRLGLKAHTFAIA